MEIMAEGGGMVLEGFLCPVCKVDLGTAAKLLAHFEKDHNEDKDVLQAFKGVCYSCFKIINNKMLC